MFQNISIYALTLSLLAIVAGASIVLTRIFNAHLARHTSAYHGLFYNYIIGLCTVTILFILSGDVFKLPQVHLYTVPLWAFGGGLLGIAVVGLSNLLTDKVNGFYLTMFIFIGQLFFGILIDAALGTFPSVKKLLGGAIVLAGLTLNLYIDFKDQKGVNHEL